jgi:Protein of unknown function (DUF935)
MARFRFQAPVRKVQTGTSYKATGLAPKPQLNSEDGSATIAPIQDVVPELISPYTRMLAYNKMMSDASVDVSVRVWKTPVLGSEFFVDPYSSDPMDQEISQFIWDNLSGGMTQPLTNAMEDILHMCEDGYSILEKVYEEREWTPPTISAGNSGKTGSQFRNAKNYVMLKKLSPRLPSTIKDLQYDNNGGPTQIIQGAIQADKSVKDVTIKIDKLVIFTLNRKGGDLTGKSVLRTAYPHWYYKNHLYKIDAIQKERHGIGVPRGKLLAGYTAQDKLIMRQMLRNLRVNEEAFIMETPNVEIDFAELSGNPVDVMRSAEHHNTMILMNVMAQFMSLGTGTSGSSGSRATGSVQSDTYMKALRFIANYICDMVNMYIIPELVVWNYPTKNFPQLKVRNIGETRDLQMLASGLANLVAQEAITMDLPTEQWVRKVFDMPAKQGGEAAYPPPTKETIQIQGVAGTGNGNKGAIAAQDVVAQAATPSPTSPTKGNVQPQNPSKGQGNVGKYQNLK